MGEIGRFLDQACEADPELMSRVADRPFCDLMTLFEWDYDKGYPIPVRGCLAGTMVIESGIEISSCRDCQFDLARKLGLKEDAIWNISGHAPILASFLFRKGRNRREADDLATLLIKNRIRRKLMMMELAKQESELQHA